MLEKQEGQKKVAFERTKHFVDNKKALEKQQVSLQEQIDDLSTQYEEEKSHLNTLKEKRNEKQTTINQLNEKLSTEVRSEEHTSELQSRGHLVCRLLLEKKKKNKK